MFEHACKARSSKASSGSAATWRTEHGRSRAWLNVKNLVSAAMMRVWEDRS